MNQSNRNWYKDKISCILDTIDAGLEVEENNNVNLETIASPEEIKNPQDCEKKISVQKDDYRDEEIETLSEELATVRKALRACGAEVHRKNRVILEKTIANRKASQKFKKETDQLMAKTVQLEACLLYTSPSPRD